MIVKNIYKNELINKIFKEIKTKYAYEAYKNINDAVLEQDEERVYQFNYGISGYEQFKLNLSIPSEPVDRSNCLGIYISIDIPQYERIGVLFMPQENGMFKYSPTWGYHIEYFNKIELNIEYTYEQCMSMAKKIIDLFFKAFFMKDRLLKRIIKLKYNIKEDIEFQKIEIEFTLPVSENKNSYLFYYSKDLKTVFFNDIFKTNYKSVINGIEEIATQIVKANSNIDPINTKWINIFININNSGIIFQKMKLDEKIYTNRANIISKILFNDTDKEEFVSYNGVEFNTEYYIPKEEVINIWNDILGN